MMDLKGNHRSTLFRLILIYQCMSLWLSVDWSELLIYIFSHEENLQTNEAWEIRTDTIFRSHVVQFKMNKSLVDKTLDGRKVTMLVTKQNGNENRWIEKQKDIDNGKENTIIRDFFHDRMMVNLSVGSVRSFSTFVRKIIKD